MRLSILKWIVQSSLISVFLCLLVSNTRTFASKPSLHPTPKPLAKKNVQVWTNAGATFGWLRFNKNYSPQFLVNVGKGPKPIDFPTFRIDNYIRLSSGTHKLESPSANDFA